MRIDGYDFEITEFDTETEASAALTLERLEDKPIMGGKVLSLPQQQIGKCVVWLYLAGNTEYYL